MATRLHRIGNIYSRVDGLIRKGHVKEVDKPIWFDVYKAFPPKYEPTFKRKAPEVEVKEIFYKEDVLRAKIHRALHNRLGIIDLIGNREMLSEKLLKSCQQYISEGMSEDEALQKIELDIKKPKESSKGSSENKADKENSLDDLF